MKLSTVPSRREPEHQVEPTSVAPYPNWCAAVWSGVTMLAIAPATRTESGSVTRYMSSIPTRFRRSGGEQHYCEGARKSVGGVTSVEIRLMHGGSRIKKKKK